MMECREAIKFLGLAHDGRLSSSDKARLDDHVHACEGCAEEKRWLSRLTDVSESLVDREVPPDLGARIVAAVVAEPEPVTVPRARAASKWAFVASIAASLVLGVAVGNSVGPESPVVEAGSTLTQRDESTFRTLLREKLGLDAAETDRLVEIRRRHDALLSEADRKHADARGRLERAEKDELWKSLPEAARERLAKIDPHFVPANPVGR